MSHSRCRAQTILASAEYSFCSIINRNFFYYIKKIMDKILKDFSIRYTVSHCSQFYRYSVFLFCTYNIFVGDWEYTILSPTYTHKKAVSCPCWKKYSVCNTGRKVISDSDEVFSAFVYVSGAYLTEAKNILFSFLVVQCNTFCFSYVEYELQLKGYCLDINFNTFWNLLN